MTSPFPFGDAALDPAAQRAADAAAYRAQLAYLFERSAFYRAKLAAAGFASPAAAGGLDGIAALPFTTKDELRRSQQEAAPFGTHLAAARAEVKRVFSTSGTTGVPSYIPLTRRDIADWVAIGSRSYSRCGLAAGQALITTYNAGPFVAGLALESFQNIGVTHIPIGTGNTERLVTALMLLKPEAIACTPSYAGYIAEWARQHGWDVRQSGLKRIMVAGEPGGGEPDMRRALEEAWNAKVYEAMGLGDIAASLWGECEAQAGMHFSGAGFVHVELIEPESGRALELREGAEGELVYTHIRREAAPLLRFRSRDHVRVWTERCACGRHTLRVRCIGRTDDMLIVRGVNVFPSAIREIVNRFQPRVSGYIAVRPARKGVKQEPPLKVAVELAAGAAPDAQLAASIADAIRSALVVSAEIVLLSSGALPRSEYKSKLVDFSEAKAA
ncbi:MAG TPA: phenylacetate--CoA ligase family protein [Alphaproteobacteria bacterium]|jgi:phenylacetate-CoA ligase